MVIIEIMLNNVATTYGIMKGGNLPKPEATNVTWQDVTFWLVKDTSSYL